MKVDIMHTRRSRGTLLTALALVAAVLWAGSPLLARDDGTTVRVFRLSYISVKDAHAAIEPLLSGQGKVTLEPNQSRISVQDRPEVIAKVAERLTAVDRKPASYVLQVELLEGGKTELPAAQRAEVDLRKLRMYPFTSYRRISLTTFDVELGTEVEADLGEGYHLSFVPALDSSPWHIRAPTVKLRTLLLEHLKKAGEEPVVVVRADVTLAENQEAYHGAAASEDAATGVVLILKALKVAGG